MSDYSMADISSLLASAGISNNYQAINSTSKPNNIDLDMSDFLQLMIVQLQSQTIDDTMDTSEMMNQMVQMQMITALTNMTETNLMTYASSLVGQTVTIGIVENNKLQERVITVTGTAMSNGSQVIFGDDGQTYALNQIMAVGRLPEIEGVTPDESAPSAGSGKPTEPAAPTNPDPVDPAGSSFVNPTNPGDNISGSGTEGVDGDDETAVKGENGVDQQPETDGTPSTGNDEYKGELGAPSDE